MGSSRSFGGERTRGSSSTRKGPMGEVILDIYSDVDTAFVALEAEVDAVHGDTTTFDVINEKTADAGVTIESVLIRDGAILTTLAVGENLTTVDSPAITINDHVSYRGEIGYSESGNTEMYFANTFSSVDSKMSFRVGGNTTTQERLTILGSGNVGVGTDVPTEKLDVKGDAIRIRDTQTPASASATGTAGTICWDAGYIYVCVADDEWERAALASW